MTGFFEGLALVLAGSWAFTLAWVLFRIYVWPMEYEATGLNTSKP